MDPMKGVEITNGPILLASVGLPRSGKSTVLKDISKRIGAPIANKDAIRCALHGMPYSVNAEPFVQAIYKVMIEALFIMGHPVVIADETNYSKEARDAVAKGPWTTAFLEFNTPPEVCVARAVKLGQTYLPPVIDQMWQRRVPLTPEEKAFGLKVVRQLTGETYVGTE